MSDSAAGLASLVLEQVARFVGRLDATQIRDLAQGRARLAVIGSVSVVAPPVGAGEPPPVPVPAAGPAESAGRSRQRSLGADVDVAATRAVIMTMSSRDEAAKYVSTIGTVAVLRRLADGFGVRLASKDRKTEIIRKIVDATLGVELTARAMRETDAAE